MPNEPGNEDANPDPKFFEGPSMSYYGRLRYKLEEAARCGAVVAVFVHEFSPTGYDWKVVRSSDTARISGSTMAMEMRANCLW